MSVTIDVNLQASLDGVSFLTTLMIQPALLFWWWAVDSGYCYEKLESAQLFEFDWLLWGDNPDSDIQKLFGRWPLSERFKDKWRTKLDFYIFDGMVSVSKDQLPFHLAAPPARPPTSRRGTCRVPPHMIRHHRVQPTLRLVGRVR